MTRFLSLLLPASLLAALLATGCGDDTGDGGVPFDGPVDAGLDAPGYYGTVPAYLNRSLDVVVVVDDSGSMAAEQRALTASFPQFINVLQQVAGGLPDLHLGVLSSNVGAAGVASVPGCNANGDDGNLLTGPPGNTCAQQFGLQGNFISDVGQPDGSRLRNYTGELAPLFTCMAQLGISGCGFEQHLESMYRALQPGKNPGFLRTDAHLAVIFLADEDDCSTELGAMFGDPNAGLSSQLGPRTSFRCFEFGVTCENDPNPRAFGVKTGCRPRSDSPYMYEVDRYVDFLKTLKPPGGPGEVVVASIAGAFDTATREVTVGPDTIGGLDPTFPLVQRSCHSVDPEDPNDGATPPVRLQAFADGFPGRSVMTSVCTPDLSDALVAVAEQIRDAIGNPCIDATLADANPDLPGLQPTCTLTDVVGDAEVAVPACPEVIQIGAGECDPGGGATPCWCLMQDVAQCPSSPLNMMISINRGGATPPPGLVTHIYCQTE